MLFLLSIIYPLVAQPIAVLQHQTPAIEVERYLNQSPQAASYIQAYLKQPGKRSELITHLKKGQFYFLDGDLDLAQKHFKMLVDLSYRHDWGQEERKILHFAHLRLAQLSSKSEQKDSYLKQALEFAPDLKMEASIFPPPLQKKYEQLARKMDQNQSVWELPIGADQFEVIVINGVIQNGHTSFVKGTERKVRITFLSNQLLPQTVIGSLSELKDMSLQTEPLLTGTCQSPRWHPSIGFSSDQLVGLFPGCQESRELALPSQQNMESLRSPNKLAQNTSSIWKSKWLWAGVSVIATGLIIQNQQNQRPQSPASEPPSVPVFSNRPNE
jgi:hypothetical protein